MDMKLLKNWKILLVLFCVVLAIVAINPTLQSGVVVKSVNSDSPFYGKLFSGEKIEWANEHPIESVNDFYAYSEYTGNFRYMHDGKLEVIDIKTPGLGVTVERQGFSNINLGMDLVGGTRILMKPMGNATSEVIAQTIATLETRINTYGLRETKFQEVTDISGNKYVQIEMAGGSRQEIDELLARQGQFEGRIPILVNFKDNTGELLLGDNSYTVTYKNTTLELRDTELTINSTITINNIKMRLSNYTEEGAVFVATVFESKDVTSVCMQDQPGICSSSVMPQSEGYAFQFQIFITQDSAQKFADVTKNMKTVVDPNSGEAQLEQRIYFYLDNKQITALSISSGLKGKAETQPSITGWRETEDETVREKLQLQSILQSGALPTELEVIKVDEISPSLGQEFISSAGLAAFAAVASVSLIIFIRYRKIKILIPMLLWSLFELILTLGAASLINWTIDLASIAGIIAAIGTGTNDQIMMIDELLLGRGDEKQIYSLKEKMKKAFFIVFGAAATIVAAMMPLLFIGIGVMKGFAITTTLGVLIGVIITRPAFAVVIEKILEKN